MRLALQGVDFAELCITSGLTIVDGAGPADAFRLPEVPVISVVVEKAHGVKCAPGRGNISIPRPPIRVTLTSRRATPPLSLRGMPRTPRSTPMNAEMIWPIVIVIGVAAMAFGWRRATGRSRLLIEGERAKALRGLFQSRAAPSRMHLRKETASPTHIGETAIAPSASRCGVIVVEQIVSVLRRRCERRREYAARRASASDQLCRRARD